jgi:hypothetical protein
MMCIGHESKGQRIGVKVVVGVASEKMNENGARANENEPPTAHLSLSLRSPIS